VATNRGIALPDAPLHGRADPKSEWGGGGCHAALRRVGTPLRSLRGARGGTNAGVRRRACDLLCLCARPLWQQRLLARAL
jgi:hypothetical protein